MSICLPNSNVIADALTYCENSQNKSDLDETFTEDSDGCCLKPNLTIPSQNKSDIDEIFTEALDGCYLQPDQTIPYQTIPNQTLPN